MARYVATFDLPDNLGADTADIAIFLDYNLHRVYGGADTDATVWREEEFADDLADLDDVSEVTPS